MDWLDMQDSLQLCDALGLSSSLAYQYAHPPHEYLLDESHFGCSDGHKWTSIQEVCGGYEFKFIYDYHLLEMKEVNKGNLQSLFRNVKFNALYSLSQRLRIAIFLKMESQVLSYLSNNQINDLNSMFIHASGNAEIVKLFLSDSRYNPSHSQNYDLIMAVKHNHIDTVKLLLLDSRVDPSDGSNLAFRTAVDSGNIYLVELLLKHSKVDPSDFNNDALITASSRGFKDIVEVLLSDPRVDPSAEGNEAIIVAASHGHLEVVKILLSDSRVNASSRRNRALNRASNFGHLEVVQLLLSDSKVLKKGNKSKFLHTMSSSDT